MGGKDEELREEVVGREGKGRGEGGRVEGLEKFAGGGAT